MYPFTHRRSSSDDGSNSFDSDKEKVKKQSNKGI